MSKVAKWSWMVACVALSACARPSTTPTTQRPTRPRPTNLGNARELNQQGVRAYRDGRYNDAAMYFRESFRLGGPPSELWNLGRALERLDDAEGAAGAFDAYIAQEGITADERLEAQRKVQLLQNRSSALTLVSQPIGVSVTVDGQPSGVTPVTVEISAGPHVVTFSREGFAPVTRNIEARFGRAIVVEAKLAPASEGNGPGGKPRS